MVLTVTRSVRSMDYGNELTPQAEYGHPSFDLKNNSYTKYVEVVPGDRFSIQVIRPPSPNALKSTLHADGQKLCKQITLPGELVLHMDGYNKVVHDETSWCDFIFCQPVCFHSSQG